MDDDDSAAGDLWQSVDSACQAIYDIFTEAKAIRGRFDDVLDFARSTKSICELESEIKIDLENLDRRISPVHGLLEIAQTSDELLMALDSLRNCGLRLIKMIRLIAESASPPLSKIPCDLRVDWESDEPWKIYSRCDSFPECAMGDAGKHICHLFQSICWDLNKNEFDRRVDAELDRIWLALPGFVASKKLEALLRSTMNEVDPKDGVYRSGELLVWDGCRYEWLTDTMMDALELLVRASRQGRKVKSAEMEGRIGPISMDGLKTIFKIDRQGWPPKHPVHEIVMGNARSGWYLARKNS
jgi:hypothetical protein